MSNVSDNPVENPEKICWQCGSTFPADAEYCAEDGAQLVELDPSETRDMLIGRVFDNRFRIVGKLGEGGMSHVYSARRVEGQGEVALKILKADFLRDEEVRKRFMYEARTIASLEHANAVDLYDFGQAPDGSFYMVMELLQGESLADRLDRGHLSYREIFAFLTPMCGVLAEAHAKDVIHRDLKPENIFLADAGGRGPIPKLLDFGIAKHLKFQTVTQSDALWGTPAYMSPEQASGDAVTGGADVYAMGVMLYELVAGVLPFRATTAMGFAVKHMHRDAPPLSATPGLKSVPDPFERLIAQMLEKEPEDRPASMERVARELERIRDEVFNPRLLDMVPGQEVTRSELAPPSDPEAGDEEAPQVDPSLSRQQTAVVEPATRSTPDGNGSAQTVIGGEATAGRSGRPTPSGWEVGDDLGRKPWWKRASTWVSVVAMTVTAAAAIAVLEPWEEPGGEPPENTVLAAEASDDSPSSGEAQLAPGVEAEVAGDAAGLATTIAVEAKSVAEAMSDDEDENEETARPKRRPSGGTVSPPRREEEPEFATPDEEGAAPGEGGDEDIEKDEDVREALEGTF